MNMNDVPLVSTTTAALQNDSEVGNVQWNRKIQQQQHSSVDDKEDRFE